MTVRTITGQCFCGAVTWAYDGPKGRNLVCHCADCQKSNAAPFSAFMGCNPDNVTWNGPITHYESTPQSWRGFCGCCGTRLYFKSDKWQGEIHILAATLDDPTQYKPDAQVCLESRLPWLDVLDDAQAHSSFQKTPVAK